MSWSVTQLREVVNGHGCIFRQFTDRSIESENLVGQDFAAEGEEAIEVIVNQSVRSQPRHDAPARSVVPKGTVVMVDECIVASGGIWCSDGFGEDIGWLPRAGLRQDEMADRDIRAGGAVRDLMVRPAGWLSCHAVTDRG